MFQHSLILCAEYRAASMKYLLGLFLWIPHQVTTWFVINFLTYVIVATWIGPVLLSLI